eukprot:9565352-Alexandrium_andersonii.AAC.1
MRERFALVSAQCVLRYTTEHQLNLAPRISRWTPTASLFAPTPNPGTGAGSDGVRGCEGARS